MGSLMSAALTTRLDLFHNSAKSHPQLGKISSTTRLDLSAPKYTKAKKAWTSTTYSLNALLVDGVDGPGEGLHALEAVVVLHADDVVAGVAVVDGEEGHQRHPGSGVVRWPDGAETRSSKKMLNDYTVKKGYRFSRPQPAGMSQTRLSLAGNY